MREGMNWAGLYHGGSVGFAGACVGCTRVLQSMEPTVVGMSMNEILQFERSIPNPAGIEWVIGSGADVRADLYMVAPVASASVPSPSALYELDPTTGAATILGGLGVEDPMDIAWDRDRSIMCFRVVRSTRRYCPKGGQIYAAPLR